MLEQIGCPFDFENGERLLALWSNYQLFFTHAKFRYPKSTWRSRFFDSTMN